MNKIPKKLEIKINGEKFGIGPFTIGHKRLFQEEFESDSAWHMKCAGQDPTAITFSVWHLLDANGREKFKTMEDLEKAMPGESRYLMVLYLKIGRLAGSDYPDVEGYDMEALTEDDIAAINADLGRLQKDLRQTDAKEEKKDQAAQKTPATTLEK